MAGIYVHIPFCGSRCVYCGFFSTTRLEERQTYVDALCREMELRGETLPVGTIYLGGGTPSQLTPSQLHQLFEHIYKVYDIAADAEVTMECNPDDITADMAGVLRELPVNRVSMGAQTFDECRLRFLRRRHSARQVVEAVLRLREAGIRNVSIDLMYGFPEETLDDWHADIEAALSLHVEHLSAYALTYEEGTPLEAMHRRGDVEEVDEELSRRMYYDLKDRLEAAGFEHYEISNFARTTGGGSLRSRHNSGYWLHTPYVGLGAGAHSYAGRRRQWNVSDLPAYLKAIGEGRVPAEGEQLDDETFYDEVVMTRLRTCEGISLDSLSPHDREKCLRQAGRYLDSGLLERCGSRLRLTREGLFVSDMVMSGLM